MSAVIAALTAIVTRGGASVAAVYFTATGRYDVASLAVLFYIALVVDDVARDVREERVLHRIGGTR